LGGPAAAAAASGDGRDHGADAGRGAVAGRRDRPARAPLGAPGDAVGGRRAGEPTPGGRRRGRRKGPGSLKLRRRNDSLVPAGGRQLLLPMKCSPGCNARGPWRSQTFAAMASSPFAMIARGAVVSVSPAIITTCTDSGR